MKGIDEAEIQREFELACALLKQFLEVQFRPPELYIGDEHQSRFITISSLRDMAYAATVQAVYNDEINGVFVPDRLTRDDVANRIFAFVHECGHALSTQQNPKLKMANVDRLTRSKARWVRTKGYVYVAFNEGFATHLAIQACLRSDRSDLVECAESEHKRLVDFFAEWTSPSSRHFSLMAEMYGVDPNNWQRVIERYLTGDSMEAVLGYYKYDLGYYLVRTLQPDASEMLRMIQQPPSTVQHIIYPETYRSNLSKG